MYFRLCSCQMSPYLLILFYDSIWLHDLLILLDGCIHGWYDFKHGHSWSSRSLNISLRLYWVDTNLYSYQGTQIHQKKQWSLLNGTKVQVQEQFRFYFLYWSLPLLPRPVMNHAWSSSFWTIRAFKSFL